MFKFTKLCGSLFSKVQGIKENVDIVDCKNEGTMQRHLAEDGHLMPLVSFQMIAKKCQNNLVLNFFFQKVKYMQKLSPDTMVWECPQGPCTLRLGGWLVVLLRGEGMEAVKRGCQVRESVLQLLMPFLSLLPDHKVNRCLPSHDLCTCPMLPQYQTETISIPCFFTPHERNAHKRVPCRIPKVFVYLLCSQV